MSPFSVDNDVCLAFRHIIECLGVLEHDRLYGGFVTRGKGIIPPGATEGVRRSSDRCLRAIRG
jgi:hypothetical protein